MFVVPGLTAFTTPVPATTVAMAVLLLLQVPPPVPLLVNVLVEPIHKGLVPLTVPALTVGVTVIVPVFVKFGLQEAVKIMV